MRTTNSYTTNKCNVCSVLLLHDKDNDGLFEVATSNIRLRLKTTFKRRRLQPTTTRERTFTYIFLF